LERISNKETAVPALMADMIRVHEHEEQLAGDSKSHSFLECFKGKNWRRTRIILYCNSISQMIGATFLSNGPYFLVNAGMSSSQTGEIVEIGLAFAIASSVITWYFLGRVGRRKIILGGIALACVFFLTMGIASCFPGSKALW
jgi:Na+/melibiose symporter-like transporter